MALRMGLMAVATALFAGSAFAANATTISATGCVDTSGMNDCLSKANSTYTSCMATAGGIDEMVLACGLEQWLQQMVCYQTSCWNKAYSCEYQYLVSEYLATQTQSPTIPFYPAPNNAPGGCSCNLGEVYYNTTESVNAVNSQCGSYVTSTSEDLIVCQCCGWSAAVSAFYGFCPGTSMEGLLVSSFETEAANFEDISGSCAELTADACAKFDFYSADNGTFLDPTNLPAAGTNALSTTAGPSSLTSPPAGETITWSAANQVFTVTAAAYNAQDVTSGVTTTTAKATGTGAIATATGTGSATESQGTATGSASTTTTAAAKTGAASAARIGSESWAVGLLCLSGLIAVL